MSLSVNWASLSGRRVAAAAMGSHPSPIPSRPLPFLALSLLITLWRILLQSLAHTMAPHMYLLGHLYIYIYSFMEK